MKDARMAAFAAAVTVTHGKILSDVMKWRSFGL
jgi:hypothetical protein